MTLTLKKEPNGGVTIWYSPELNTEILVAKVFKATGSCWWDVKFHVDIHHDLERLFNEPTELKVSL